MIKLYLLSIFTFFSFLSFSQTETAEIAEENNCLFGYISDNPEEFNQVINYVKNLGLNVLSDCEEEYIIYVKLNHKYKDYTDLFSQIETRFKGKCYFKSQENKIPRYNKCRGQYIKENFKN